MAELHADAGAGRAAPGTGDYDAAVGISGLLRHGDGRVAWDGEAGRDSWPGGTSASSGEHVMNALEGRLRDALRERARQVPIGPGAWDQAVARTWKRP